MLKGIGPKYLLIAIFLSFGSGKHSCGIVAGCFGISYTPRGCTGELFFYINTHRCGIVGAGRAQDDDESVPFGRAYANSIIAGKQQGADVQCMVSVGRTPISIKCDQLTHAFYKNFFRYLRHLHAYRRNIKTVKIIKGTENSHLAVGLTISFDALEYALSVMQGGIARVN